MKALGVFEQINQVIELLNIAEKIFVSGFLITEEQLMQTLGKYVLEVFPNIIELYESEELFPQEENIDYWCGQMERTVAALKGNDRFFLLDVLMYELKPNLIMLNKQLIVDFG